MDSDLGQYLRLTNIRAVAAVFFSVIGCFVAAPPASAGDNQLIFSILKLAEVPKFSAGEIEKRLKAIFKIDGNTVRYDSADLPKHLTDPHFWAFGADASLPSDPEHKKFMITCNRMGRGALAVHPTWPPNFMGRQEEQELPGVWPVFQSLRPKKGENIAVPEDVVARLSCSFIGISRNDTNFDATEIAEHLASLFSNITNKTTDARSSVVQGNPAAASILFATSGKSHKQMRPDLFKMVSVGETVGIQFAVWLLAPNS